MTIPTTSNPLLQRLIEDMTARNRGPASHIRACKKFAAWLGRSPDTATPDDVRNFVSGLGSPRRRGFTQPWRMPMASARRCGTPASG